MTSALVVPTWAAIVTVLVVAGLVFAVVRLADAVRQTREATRRVLASAAADAERLREELGVLEDQLEQLAERSRELERYPEITVVDDREYVITDLERRRARGPLGAVPTLPTPVFADILLRESLIRTASIAAGLRRALAPEVRNRVRFEMKREVKRSRKQRRADTRMARREVEARRRASVPTEGTAR